jgi:hypothetical protein
MQEHRKYQASMEQAQRIFEHMINCLKIFLKLMRQIFNEAIYEGAPLYIVLDLGDSLSSLVDRRHLN